MSVKAVRLMRRGIPIHPVFTIIFLTHVTVLSRLATINSSTSRGTAKNTRNRASALESSA